MTKLTQEQSKTLEDAFATLPEVVKNIKSLYVSMKGIQEQLNRGDKIIFYMKQNNMGGMDIHKMKVEE